MRLDKFVSNSTNYTRSQVKKLIKLKRVYINELVAKDPSTEIAIHFDIISLDNQELKLPSPFYYMLNKPAGYICSNDSDQPTVLDLIELSHKKKVPLQIAGRLDKDTTGLVLLTNDGHWNHRVTSPVTNCFKHYRVMLEKPLQPSLVDLFQSGLHLNKEKDAKVKFTRPADLQIINDYHANLAIQEGRYHQVKRMFAAVGNRVLKLHRYRIGALELDLSLAEGEYRPLNSEEIGYF